MKGTPPHLLRKPAGREQAPYTLSRPVSRRSLLTGLLPGAVLLAFRGTAQAAPASGGRRIIALDWESAAQLMSLGFTPAAAPEKERYGGFVVEPALPESVAELGLRAEPNLELIHRLRPGCIVTSGGQPELTAKLAASVPVITSQPFSLSPGTDQFTFGLDALAALAKNLDAEPQAATFRASLESRLAQARQRLSAYDGRPLYLVSLMDTRRGLVFASNSLYRFVLDRLGLVNAWTEEGTAFGHRTITLDELAANPDARLVTIGNEGRVRAALAAKLPVLSSLPAVRAGRVTMIGNSLFYGGAPAANLFLQQISNALTGPAA